MTSKNVRVHSLQSTVFPCESYAICGAYRNHNNLLRAESFLLFRKNQSEVAVQATRISIRNDAGPECPIVLDEEFALAEALNQAKIDFGMKVYEAAAASAAPHAIPRTIIEEVGAPKLVSLWVRGIAKDQLNGMRITSECSDLSDLLNQLYALPTVTFGKVPL